MLQGLQSFADNKVFFGGVDLLETLAGQLYSTVIYAVFLVAVCLIDFYRKEFNL